MLEFLCLISIQYLCYFLTYLPCVKLMSQLKNLSGSLGTHETCFTFYTKFSTAYDYFSTANPIFCHSIRALRKSLRPTHPILRFIAIADRRSNERPRELGAIGRVCPRKLINQEYFLRNPLMRIHLYFPREKSGF